MKNVFKKLILSLFFAVYLTGSSAAGEEPTASVSRQMISATALPNVPGRALTAVTVEIAPGISIPSHAHDAFVFAYVLEGTIRSQLNDAEAVEYVDGQSWIEPPGTLHVLTHNPSDTDSAKILVIFVAKENARLTTSGELSR